MMAKPYLRRFSIQPSVREGIRQVRQDRDLGEAIKRVAVDGRIDVDRLDGEILLRLADGNGIAKSEAGLVDLLDAARDGRRRTEIDGVRIRMTPAAERRFVHHRAQLEGLLPAPAGLDEAGFRAAASASVATWYRGAVADAWADIEGDDPEALDPAARARDLALFGRVGFGERLFGLQSALPEHSEFYRNRTFFDAAGAPVPASQVRLLQMDHEPEYAGQVLTSLLALDRRDGALLAHLWTVD